MRLKKLAKPNKEKKSRKRRKIRCLRIHDIERFYEIINYVQVKLKETNIFISDEKMQPMAENIMRDLGVKFSKEQEEGRCYYHIMPPEREIDVDVILDEMADEDANILFLEEE